MMLRPRRKSKMFNLALSLLPNECARFVAEVDRVRARPYRAHP